MTPAERHIKIYCPSHRIAFEATTSGVIVCAADPHPLAQRFPQESFWEHCCDCQRFWPSDLKPAGRGAASCPNCERPIKRRYLCAHCKVMSVASGESGGGSRRHEIESAGAVAPDCPGCGRTPNVAAVSLHACPAVAVSFATARAACPFCDETFARAQDAPAAAASSPEVAPLSFPAAAADCLSSADGRGVSVKFDPLRSLFVRDVGGGMFGLVQDRGVPGGVIYLIPRLTRFQTPLDFFNHYEQFYDCARPAVGEVWIKEPAVVEAVAGGWRLREKGEIEVRFETSLPPSAFVTQRMTTEPKLEAAPPPTPPPAPVDATLRIDPETPRQARDTTPVAQTVRITSPMPTPTPTGPTPPPTTPTPTTPTPTTPTIQTTPAPERKLPAAGLIGLVAAVALVTIVVFVWSRRSADTDTTNTNAVKASPTPGAATAGGSPVPAPQPSPPEGMVYVPGGEFMMGSNSDPYERPPHRVRVEPFFLDTYEVTCESYAAFVRAEGRTPPPSWKGGGCPDGWARRPVTGVSWEDATAYARWAGKRLPTEQEWEFAARGTEGRRYPWGERWTQGAANIGDEDGGLVDVGTYSRTSPFGAYDMSGNAWEWTASDFDVYPGGDDSLLKKQRAGKVIRGGCYASTPAQATTTYRGVWPPTGENYDRTGFRCVKDLPK